MPVSWGLRGVLARLGGFGWGVGTKARHFDFPELALRGVGSLLHCSGLVGASGFCWRDLLPPMKV
jgi:hypothetical protein